MDTTIQMNPQQQLLSLIEQFVTGIFHLEKRTTQGYRKPLISFITYLKRNSVRLLFPMIIGQETIKGWIAELRTQYGRGTVVPWVQTLARFLAFLENKGYLLEDPLNQLQKQYPKRGLTGIVLAFEDPSFPKSLQTLKPFAQFTSTLGQHMQDFITLGRSQGKIYRNEEEVLCRFDRFLNSYTPPPQQLTEPMVQKWLSLFPASHSANRYINFGIVRRFCLYLRRFDSFAYVPDPSLSPPPPPSTPYIYSRSQIKALLEAALQLKPSTLSPLRPQTYHMLILLLYTTGMRLGEALKLELGDIAWESESLYIRKTKFFKSRLVPLSPSMMKALKDYLNLRERFALPTTPQSPLFQNPHRRSHYSKSATETTFRKLLENIGLKPNTGHTRPRIHDLRHYGESFKMVSDDSKPAKPASCSSIHSPFYH
jgi:integrase/recombinase XerD